MVRLQGLIFDLDGTLLDSAPDLRQALNQTLRAHKRRDLTLDEVKHMVGDGMLPLLSRAFAATGGPISDAEAYLRFQEFLLHYRDQKPDPAQIYPGGKETLEHYHKAGVKLGICTNKHEASTIRLLEELNLKHYFTFIAGGDTFLVHKPHPDHVRGVIEGLSVPVANCVMIGDGRNDVLAAQGAGIPCLAVTHGYGEDYGHLDADGLISGFNELPRALEKLGFTTNE
ncbi:MAG: HAD-IA family hydrolase [Alphaproteobacteria bacterium]|nr:HAD-IA family hydrolase [Alphaproteobacteria bacterium]